MGWLSSKFPLAVEWSTGLHANGYYSVHYVDFNKRLDGEYSSNLECLLAGYRLTAR